MPTKKPITRTPIGSATPKAMNVAQRIPMFAAQNPIAPSTARPPWRGSRTNPKASRVPVEIVAGTLLSFSAVRLAQLLPSSESRRSRSPGTSMTSRKTMATPPAIAAGTIVIDTGLGPARTPVSSRTPKTITAIT